STASSRARRSWWWAPRAERALPGRSSVAWGRRSSSATASSRRSSGPWRSPTCGSCDHRGTERVAVVLVGRGEALEAGGCPHSRSAASRCTLGHVLPDEFPQPFGRYQLIERLAVGGMAELFVAKVPGEHGFEKHVVIKRLLPHMAATPH